MKRPDPRSGDDTDALPSASESFAVAPEVRGLTTHIVGRAAALLTLFREPGMAWWASELEADELQLGPLEAPAWSRDEFVGWFSELDPIAGRHARSLRREELDDWAGTLPDDVSLAVDWRPRDLAVAQEDAVNRLRE